MLDKDQKKKLYSAEFYLAFLISIALGPNCHLDFGVILYVPYPLVPL